MSVYNKFEQDNIYFNVEMLGDAVSPNSPQRLMTYDVTLNDSIVENSSKYYCAVTDFAIPLTGVPIMIAPIVPNSGLTNTMTLALNLVVDGVIQPSVSLIFVPENTFLPQVNQIDPNNMIITPYYFLYDYNSLINMMNVALTTAFNAMVTAFPAYVQSTNNRPFFVYYPETNLISIVTHISWATNITQVHNVNIQINEDFITYLQSFSYFYLYRNGLEYAQFKIYTNNQNGYPVNTFPVAPAYIENVQSYVSLMNWSDLKKIVIVSNSLPIAGESIQRNTIKNDIVNTQFVLSSFTPQVEKAGDQRGIVYYNPTSQYRLLDITNDVSIRRVDVTVFWEDQKNNWYILDLVNNDNATIRLAFLKKDLYKSNLLKKM